MSETITFVVGASLLVVTLVILFWAALTLVQSQRPQNDLLFHCCFSGLLATLLVVNFLIRSHIHASYMSAALFGFLMLLSWVASLLLLVVGIVLAVSARRRRAPYVHVLVATGLSVLVFTALCLAFLR